MGGWESKKGQKTADSFDNNAEYIENWVVGHDGLETRPGYKIYAELEDDIDFLWSHQNGSEKCLIAFANDKAYEIGTSGECVLIQDDLPPGQWMAIHFQNKSIFVNEHCKSYAYA